jgi:hypothetical protein
MAWTYTPVSTSKDKVRLLTGDTDTTDQLLQDEEIAYVLGVQASISLASAACCDLIAAKFARQVNTQNGALRVSAVKRYDHYIDLAKRLRAGGAGDIPGDSTVMLAEGFAGGLTVSGKENLAADTDAVQPSFRVGQDDYEATYDDETWRGS